MAIRYRLGRLPGYSPDAADGSTWVEYDDPSEVWTRVEPLAAEAGDVAGEYQASRTAYAARWVARLADGLFAVVTRYYYVAARLDRFMERTDEYVVCRDPDDPDGTAEDGGVMRRREPVGYEDEDPEELATESFPPEPGEWEKYSPFWVGHLEPAA